jgi:hypothetical protein
LNLKSVNGNTGKISVFQKIGQSALAKLSVAYPQSACFNSSAVSSFSSVASNTLASCFGQAIELFVVRHDGRYLPTIALRQRHKFHPDLRIKDHKTIPSLQDTGWTILSSQGSGDRLPDIGGKRRKRKYH